MKQNAFTAFLSNVGDECKKNSPALLTFFGLTSMAAAMIMVAKSAPKAEQRLIESRRKRYEEWKEQGIEDVPMTRKEKALDIWEDVKAVAPIYAPATVTFAVGSACIIGSYKISNARLSAITTAYGIAENKLVEYQKKVVEEIGEEKEKEIRKAITRDHMDEEEKKNGLPAEPEVDGTQLWFDDVSKRYFRSTIQDIYDAKEHVNVTLQSSPVSLNEFYCVLGLDEVEALDIYEWPEGSKLEFRFETHLLKDGITTCTSICYDVPVGGDYYTRY